MAEPQTRYAKSGDVHIAYQVLGQGPIDIVFVQGFLSNLEVQWEDPGMAHLLTRLAGVGRLILFDKRGSGLSDRVTEMPTLETRMEDVRAVMDAAGVRQAALIGGSEGGPMSILFAATYPERTRALVLYGAYAHFHSAVQTREQVEAFCAEADRSWGSGASLKAFAPGMAGDKRFCAWFARFERLGATPAAVIQLARMNSEIDVRPVLPVLRLPTLVIHRRNDVRVKVAAGRELARLIGGAQYVELAGADHPIWVGDTDAVVDAIEAFLTGAPPIRAAHRVLSNILSVEILESRSLGTLDELRALARARITGLRGRELPSGSDAVLALFDGPTRAVQCALTIRDVAKGLGVAVRAGVHTGEVEMHGDTVGGVALRIAAQIARAAKPGDVLVSGTVRDLMIGAPVAFSERGECALEGVSQRMRLLAAIGQGGAPAASGSTGLQRLSARERQVLGLVAHGMTNPEIAAALALSEHTVKRHVANILLKLELPTRAAAAYSMGR